MNDTQRAFNRFGTRALLFAKFVPGLGAVATAMSGVVGASLSAFVLYDVVGAAIWAGSGVALGVVFHDALDDVLKRLASLGRAGLLLVVAALAIFLLLKYWRRRQFFQELRMARISVEELFQLLSGDAKPLLVDARPLASRALDGMIPGAVPIEALRDGTGHARLDGEVVVYCACPNEASAARVAKQLKTMGFTRVRPLAGGIHAWQDAGFGIAPG